MLRMLLIPTLFYLGDPNVSWRPTFKVHWKSLERKLLGLKIVQADRNIEVGLDVYIHENLEDLHSEIEKLVNYMRRIGIRYLLLDSISIDNAAKILEGVKFQDRNLEVIFNSVTLNLLQKAEDILKLKAFDGIVISLANRDYKEHLVLERLRRIISKLKANGLTFKTILIDIPALDISLLKLFSLKEKLIEICRDLANNVMVGTAPINLPHIFKKRDTRVAKVKLAKYGYLTGNLFILNYMLALTASLMLGADFILYGPIEYTLYVYNACRILRKLRVKARILKAEVEQELTPVVGSIEDLLRLTRESIIKADEKLADKIIKELDKSRAYDKVLDVIVKSLNELSQLEREGEITIVDLMKSCNIVLKILARIPKRKTIAKAVIGTIKDDYHSLGKDIVKAVMEIHGIEVVDLGVNVDPKQFIQAIKKYKPKIVAVSVGLFSARKHLEHLVKLLREEGLRNKVILMVGGSAITREYAKSIHADICDGDAFTAVRELLKKICI